ncbi:MAG: ABC transporter permease [Patescibacteria group bacterium]
MRFFDYFRTAFRNLARQKLRTFLTIVAITIGSLSVILMVSLLTTIRTSVYDFFAEMDAFTLVTVTPDPDAADSGGGLIKGDSGDSSTGKILDDTALQTLKALPHVADATAISSVWIKNIRLDGEDKKMWGNIIAYDPASTVFNMPLLAGRELTADDMDKIIIGTRFAKTYGYAGNPEALIGQHVVFMFGGMEIPDWGGLEPEKPPEGDNKDWWEQQQKKTIEVKVEIVGIAQNSTFDDSQNFITLAWSKKLNTQVRWEWQNNCDEKTMKEEKDKQFGPDCQPSQVIVKSDERLKNGYGSIILKTDDTANIPLVSDAVAKLGYGVSTAQDMLDEINKILLSIGAVLGIIGGISLFVAAIGIINTMVMATYERTKEIGVMRACGATRSAIRRLFTFEAALLGFFGGVFGLGLAMVIGRAANFIADHYASNIDLPFDKVSSFPWWLIVGVIAFTTVVGLISGLAPAIRAARMNPVDALRYE